MAYRLPHEFEIDRATSRLELVRENPEVSFGMWNERGAAWYRYQLGHWYDTGFNEITNLDEIPQWCKDAVAKNPPRGSRSFGPTVTDVCRICGDEMNASDLNDHYLDHYNRMKDDAGTLLATPAVPTKDAPESTKKHDANRVGR